MTASEAQRWKRMPPGAKWGEFGADDQLGRVNLITPERRLDAVREVSAGLTFSLSLPLNLPGGADMVPSRRGPIIEPTVRATGEASWNYAFPRDDGGARDVVSDDKITVWTQYSTQWDSLAHWGQEFDADGDGVPEIVYYNGFRGGDDVVDPDNEGLVRAAALGLENVAVHGMQARGVLIDLVTPFGSDRRSVGWDELKDVIRDQKIEIRPGDVVCFYTGWANLVTEMAGVPDVDVLRTSCPVLDGRDPEILNWITESGAAAICADNLGVEAVGGAPALAEDGVPSSIMPLHEHCIFKLGVLLGEMWYLQELAAWLRQAGRHSFLLTAPPLRLPGTVGSPVTPIATV